MAQDQIEKRVRKLEATILLCICAAACGVALIISTIGVPSLAFWGRTRITSSATEILTISAFGTIFEKDFSGGTIFLPGLVGNYLPGVTILVGTLMVLWGIKSKKMGIVGGILAIAGPIIFIAMLLTLNIAFLKEDYVFGVQNILSSDSNLLSGFIQDSFVTISWSMGTSAYLPLGAGALAIFGSIYGRET